MNNKEVKRYDQNNWNVKMRCKRWENVMGV